MEVLYIIIIYNIGLTPYSISIQPHGNHMASGGADGKVKIWSLGPLMKNILSSRSEPLPPLMSEVPLIPMKDPTVETPMAHGGSEEQPIVLNGGEASPGPIGGSPPLPPISPTNGGDEETKEFVDLVVLAEMRHHSAAVNCVRWSPSGTTLASASDDSSISISEQVAKCSNDGRGEVWKSFGVLKGHEGEVQECAWCGGSVFLASGGVDTQILLWDTLNRTLLQRLLGHSSYVNGIVWDPLCKYLASQSEDRTLIIWHISGPKVQLLHTISAPFEYSHSAQFRRLGWSPDGQYILSTHGTSEQFHTSPIISRPNSFTVEGTAAGVQSPIIVTVLYYTIYIYIYIVIQ